MLIMYVAGNYALEVRKHNSFEEICLEPRGTGNCLQIHYFDAQSMIRCYYTNITNVLEMTLDELNYVCSVYSIFSCSTVQLTNKEAHILSLLVLFFSHV